ncbi:hypothetical protein J31TS4_17340 [Paenibacillus sp. J31TS4]|uniref:YfjL-like protein n=1 Tax=Paenibacillus sp. J31TS4 TaxID=2807195 RepID=UPI001B0817F8|nr:hypothetical protein [Paenibacillus sp. J31TS4]GIP38454.1 hypothetical protein J31TS4_17340 [Paenibacillus sp. J31TS4]
MSVIQGKRKRSKKKLVYWTLLVVLVLAVGFVHNAFNGNPVSKWLGGREVGRYLAETYPGREFRVKDGFYNFKDSGYAYQVVEIGTSGEKGKAMEYDFTVRGAMPRVVSDGIRYANLDTELIERLAKEAGVELKGLLQPALPLEIKMVDPQLEVVKGELPPETKWEKGLVLDPLMSLYVLLNAEGATPQTMLEAAGEIQRTLNQEGYRYSRVMLNANGFDGKDAKDEHGYVKYAVAFEPDTKLAAKDVETYNQ